MSLRRLSTLLANIFCDSGFRVTNPGTPSVGSLKDDIRRHLGQAALDVILQVG
jgi:hypothetical protein